MKTMYVLEDNKVYLLQNRISNKIIAAFSTYEIALKEKNEWNNRRLCDEAVNILEMEIEE